MAYEHIVPKVAGRAGIVTLARGKLNPLSKDLLTELTDALVKYDQNPEIRCMVIFGGDTVYCAGADIKEMVESAFADAFAADSFGAVSDAIQSCRKPIITGVLGPALGGGCELAMMCDIIIAGESAQFGQPEINLGIIAGIGGTQRLTRAIGKAKSMEMHLTGRRMTATEAEQNGLVSRVVADDEVKSEVMKLADLITRQPPLAVIALKEAINRAEEVSLREGLLHERRLFHSLFATNDRAEGMQAFVEKRTAVFKGH
ncbi:MAG: enoyl-CoA hydratase-related protein [Rhodobacteraceae bacterium]|nr:enoyl-CoA hydratase-related protein [Paracoccaceae bacterium]